MRTAYELWRVAWEAIEAGRTEELGRLFAPDAELLTPTASGTGVEYVTGVFSRHRAAYPDLRHEVLAVVEGAGGGTAAVEMVFTGTHRGTLRHPRTGTVLPPTGQQLRWTAVDAVVARDDRIVSWHAYFDRLGMLEQFEGGGDTRPASPLAADRPPPAR